MSTLLQEYGTVLNSVPSSFSPLYDDFISRSRSYLNSFVSPYIEVQHHRLGCDFGLGAYRFLNINDGARAIFKSLCMRHLPTILPDDLSLTFWQIYQPLDGFIQSMHSVSSVWSRQTSCYYPNGQKNSFDIPCDRNAPVSVCCGDPAMCLSNGLCRTNNDQQMNTNISYARGTCTDNQWGSSICLQHCLSSKVFNLQLKKAANCSAWLLRLSPLHRPR